MRLTQDGLEKLLDAARAASSDQEALDTLAEGWSVATHGQVLVELFNVGEYELMAATLPADHIQDMTALELPDMGVFRGRGEYAQMLAGWVGAFPNAQLEVEELVSVEEPPAAFLVVKQTVEGGASGVPLEFPYAVIAERSEARRETKFSTDVESARAEFELRYGKLTR